MGGHNHWKNQQVYKRPEEKIVMVERPAEVKNSSILKTGAKSLIGISAIYGLFTIGSKIKGLLSSEDEKKRKKSKKKAKTKKIVRSKVDKKVEEKKTEDTSTSKEETSA